MGEEKNRQTSNLQFAREDTDSPQVTVYAILVVLSLATQFMLPGYLKPTYMAGILRLTSFIGIATVDQDLTMLTGGIDLFIASTVTLANVTVAQIMTGQDENPSAMLFTVIVMGAMVGFINGVGIHWPKIPSFIMTLGVGAVIQGVFLIYVRGVLEGNAPPLLKVVCEQNFISILSGVMVIWAVMTAVTVAPLRNTSYGRKMYSVGTDEQVAGFSGIHTERVTFSVHLMSVIIATVSGFFLVGCTGTSFLDVGTSYNTKTITAAITGGTAVTRERGGHIRTIAGAIVMTILNDFLAIVNISEVRCQVMQGVTIALLVLTYSEEKHKEQTGTQSMESLMRQYREQLGNNTRNRRSHTC